MKQALWWDRSRLAMAMVLTGVALAACKPETSSTATPPAFEEVPTVAQPTWIGDHHWAMRDSGQTGAPFHLQLGFTALPSGNWLAVGSIILDDAELGATGSARLRNGRLLMDLMLSGGVRDVPLDEGKRALFAPGQAPASISSAGFATLRIDLDPKTLRGSAQRYQVNVVEGNRVQGPIYAESRLTPVPKAAPASAPPMERSK